MVFNEKLLRLGAEPDSTSEGALVTRFEAPVMGASAPHESRLAKPLVEELRAASRSLGDTPHVVALCDAAGAVLHCERAGGPPQARGEVFAPPAGLTLHSTAVAGPEPLQLHVASATEGCGPLSRHVAQRLQALRQGESAAVFYDVICAVARFTAHAMGNPLAGLSLTFELMGGVAQGTDMQRYLTRCTRVAERLAEFKEHLGVLGGAIASEPQEVDVESFVRDFLARQGLSSEYVTPVDIEPGATTMVCHPGVLSDAVGYLVRNATDASPGGGTIGFRASVLPGFGVRLAVWDDGPGIPAAFVSRLFKEPVSSKQHGGGLGLMLVGMIVERIHGGRASFTPRSPGVCFNLDLPGRGGERQQGSAT